MLIFDFKPLIEDFHDWRGLAVDLETPSPADNHRIRLAMVGFSRSADIVLWNYQHCRFIQN